MLVRIFVIPCLALALACASIEPTAAPIDWSQVGDWSVHVVTTDADGELRVTRIWLVVVDGRGAIRTQDSRWFANIERGSDIWIRTLGSDYAVDAERVLDVSLRQRIDAAFLEKYGWQERLVIQDDRAESDDPYMLLVAKSG